MESQAVVLLDVDTLLLKPLTPLIDEILLSDKEAYYTKDWGMVNPGNKVRLAHYRPVCITNNLPLVASLLAAASLLARGEPREASFSSSRACRRLIFSNTSSSTSPSTNQGNPGGGAVALDRSGVQ